MSSQRDMPEPWATAAIKRNLTKRDGSANLTALARAANGPSVETVRRLVWGRGTSSQETIEKVADALGLDVTVVSEWAGQRRKVPTKYAPPQEADLLDGRQRAAVDELIRAMVAPSIARGGWVSNSATVEHHDAVVDVLERLRALDPSQADQAAVRNLTAELLALANGATDAPATTEADVDLDAGRPHDYDLAARKGVDERPQTPDEPA